MPTLTLPYLTDFSTYAAGTFPSDFSGAQNDSNLTGVDFVVVAASTGSPVPTDVDVTSPFNSGHVFSSGGDRHAAAGPSGTVGDNVAAYVTVITQHPDGYAGVRVRGYNLGNRTTESYYWLGISKYGVAALFKRSGGIDTLLAGPIAPTGAGFSPDEEQTYLKLIPTGARLQGQVKFLTGSHAGQYLKSDGTPTMALGTFCFDFTDPSPLTGTNTATIGVVVETADGNASFFADLGAYDPSTIRLPSGSLTSPTAGENVSGNLSLTGTYTPGDNPIALVNYVFAGATQGTSSAGPAFSTTVNTLGIQNNTYTAVADIVDNQGNTATTAGVAFTIFNDIAVPRPTIVRHMPGPISLWEPAYDTVFQIPGTTGTSIPGGFFSTKDCLTYAQVLDGAWVNSDAISHIIALAQEIRSQSADLQLGVYSNVGNIYNTLLQDWFLYADTHAGVHREDAFFHAAVAFPYAYNVGGTNVRPFEFFWACCDQSGTSFDPVNGPVTVPATAGQALYLGYSDPFREVNFSLTSAGSGGYACVYEVPTAVNSSFAPTVWTPITPLSDTSNGLTSTGAGKLLFDPPPNWQPSIPGVPGTTYLYWIRVRATTSGSAPVCSSILGRNFNAQSGSSATTPVFDSNADVNHDGYLTDAEYASAASGKTARFVYESRLTSVYGDGRLAVNVAHPNVVAWAIDFHTRLLAQLVDVHGNQIVDWVFMDNSWATTPGIDPNQQVFCGGASPPQTLEPYSNYHIDYATLLNKLSRGLPAGQNGRVRWVVPNKSIGIPGDNIYHDLLPADWWEFKDRAEDSTYDDLNTTLVQVANILSYATNPVIILDTMMFTKAEYNSGQTVTQTIAIYQDPRRQLSVQCEHLMVCDGVNVRLTVSGGENLEWPVGIKYWPSLSADIGMPSSTVDTSAAWAQENDSNNYGDSVVRIAKVFRRSFTKMVGGVPKVTWVYWKSNSLDSPSAGNRGLPFVNSQTYSLGGTFVPLNPDGTLGAPTTTITLANNEGAIMLPVGFTPTIGWDGVTAPTPTAYTPALSATSGPVGTPFNVSVTIDKPGSDVVTGVVTGGGLSTTLTFTFTNSTTTAPQALAPTAAGKVNIAWSSSPTLSGPANSVYTSGPSVALAQVNPGGQTLTAYVVDGNGNPSVVTGFSANSVQDVYVEAASGHFTLAFNGSAASAAIPVGAHPSVVRTALNALSTIGAGGVDVTGLYPYRVELSGGALAGVSQPLITIDGSGLSATGSVVGTSAGAGSHTLQPRTSNFVSAGAWYNYQFDNAVLLNTLGDGQSYCAWKFPGLAAGTYTIGQNLDLNPTYQGVTLSPVQNARYRFYDGDWSAGSAAYLGSVYVNQNAPGSPRLPFDFGQGCLQYFGCATVASGTLTVVLCDDVTGADVGRTFFADYMGIAGQSLATDGTTNYVPTTVNNGADLINAGWDLNPNRFQWSLANADASQWGGVYGSLDQSHVQANTWNAVFNVPSYPPGTYDVYLSWSTVPSPLITQFRVDVYEPGSGTPTSFGPYAVAGPTWDKTVADGSGNNVGFKKVVSAYSSAHGGFRVELVPLDANGAFTVGAMNVVATSIPAYAESVTDPAPTYVRQGGPPTITVNGTTTALGCAAVPGIPLWSQGANNWPLEAHVTWPLTVTIRDTDTVAINVASGTIECAAGAVGAVVNGPVDVSHAPAAGQDSGTPLVPVVPRTTKTMEVGWNTYEPGQGQVAMFANLMKGTDLIGAVSNTSYGAAGGGIDTDFYPVFTGWQGMQTGLGYTGPSSGTVTLKWDSPPGQGFGEFLIVDAGGAARLLTENTGHATGNSRTYTGLTSATAVFIGYGVTVNDLDVGRTSYAGNWSEQTSNSNTTRYYFCGGCKVSDGSSGATATVNLGVLPAGSYDFSATWVPDPGRTTNATWTVTETGQSGAIATFNADQTSGPSGAGIDDPVIPKQNQVDFTRLGTFISHGGTVSVVLSTGGQSATLCMDAMRATWSTSNGAAPGVKPVANAQVYPYHPSIDPTNPASATAWHPDYVAKLQGAASVRSINLFGMNGCQILNYSEYPAATNLTWWPLHGHAGYTVTAIENYDDTTTNWFQSNQSVAKLTLAANHDIPDGNPTPMFFNLNNFGGSPVPDGGSVVVTGAGQAFMGFNGLPVVLYKAATVNPNQLLVGAYSHGKGTVQAATPTAPTNTLGRASVSIPPEIYADLINLIPGCDAWVNVPPNLSSAGRQQLATTVGNRLHVVDSSGHRKKIKVEDSNEPWNFGAGYAQFGTFQVLANLQGISSDAAYTLHAAQVHADFAVGLAACTVDRSGDLIRLFGSFEPGSQAGETTAVICATAAAHAIPVDAIVIGCYYTNGPVEQPGQSAVCKALNAGQLVDCFEVSIVCDSQSHQLFARQHLATIRGSALPNANGPATIGGSVHQAVKLYRYEGAIRATNLSQDFTSGATEAYATVQSQAVLWHPRVFGITLAIFLLDQNAGVSEFNYYNLSQSYAADTGITGTDSYVAYYQTTMPPGTGNNAVDGQGGPYDVISAIAGVPPVPPDYNRAASQVGGAWNTWSALAGTGVVPPAPPPRRHLTVRWQGRHVNVFSRN
jgi:hypothetical protein